MVCKAAGDFNVNKKKKKKKKLLLQNLKKKINPIKTDKI
jgi:hypothetical protein